MAKTSGRQKRFVNDAALQALVRFQPQLDVLKQAQNEAKSQYLGAVSGANAGQTAIQQAVDQARPGLAQVYDQSGLDAAHASQTLIGRDLAGLGPVADSIKAGAALEAAGMTGNLASAKAAALGDLTNRRVQATTGAVTAKRQARSELATNLAKILQSQQDILGQKGTFEASTLSDLQNQELDRSLRTRLNSSDNRQSERNSLRSAGINPDTGQPIPGGKLDPRRSGRGTLPGGVRLRSADAHEALSNKLQATLSLAKQIKAAIPHATRGQVAAALMAGDPGASAETVHDTKTGRVKLNPDGTEAKTTPRPRVDAQPQFLTSLALDLLYDGHVSRKNVAGDAAGWMGLHQRGYSLRDLGLPGPTSAQAASDRRKKNSAGARTSRAAAGLADLFGSL